MARLTSEELQTLMKNEGVSRIWSWSKWNCFHTSPYEYFLKYILHKKEDRTDCIYTTTGGIAHDIMERRYTGKLPYEQMIDDFEDGWVTAFNIAEMKFDRNSPEKNDKISQKYYENLKHFFINHTPLKYKPVIEQFVKAKIGDNLFQGYIDVCFKDDEGNFNILDWKTSSIYKGKKAENECGQLVVYAIGLNQQGVPMDKIHICWNFLKYVSIQYEQANGAVKTREVERCKIGESLQTNAKMWLKKLGYTDQVDDYLKQLLDTNDIECLPKEVQEKYIISDCYVYVPLTDELINRWKETIISTINDIELREKDYEETHSDKAFWDTDESVEAQSYYFSTLCGYSPNLHLPYKAYLERTEKAKDGDVFSGVGSSTVESSPVAQTNKVIHHKDTENVDLSWLDNI
ncbi:MAG: PD-(D/E)XK nuclease family protein [Intestinibacter bartlettii]|nr:PD-(D/E)XK nuclease family protein [Intestinibacter bartlettii]